MKTIGLIGGMSWESTIPYYSIINMEINKLLGKNHSAKCLIYSFDFQEIEELQYIGDWSTLEMKILEAGNSLKSAGAELIVLCTNTMHKVVSNFENKVGLPLIHIAEAVGEEVVAKEIKRIGLLGTIFTMEQDFYKSLLQSKFNLEVIIPEKEDMERINYIIYNELVKGIIKDESRNEYLRIMDKMVENGAEGMILGCTEIGLLIKEYKLDIFDSTSIHAKKAVKLCIKKEKK